MRPVRHFLTALGFLTRLGPARMLEPSDVAASVACMPLVGALLGLATVLPWRVGLLSGHPWVQAWLLAGLGLWLTRGLHWDGWADLWDAWGSGARDETFWRIMKDSRVGAFGVMGLVLGIGGQILLTHEALAAGALGVLVFGPVLGRTLVVALCRFSGPLARPGLGQAFITGATTRALIFSAAFCLPAGAWLAGPRAMGLALCLGLAGAFALHRLATSRGGLNGDFMGALILWGELCAPLGWLLAAR